MVAEQLPHVNSPMPQNVPRIVDGVIDFGNGGTAMHRAGGRHLSSTRSCSCIKGRQLIDHGQIL